MDDISAIATMGMDDEPMPSVEEAPEPDPMHCEVCGEKSLVLYSNYDHPTYACYPCHAERCER